MTIKIIEPLAMDAGWMTAGYHSRIFSLEPVKGLLSVRDTAF